MISVLSKNQKWLLFIHLTLGQTILYPFLFPILILSLNLQDYLSLQVINILLDSIVILLTLFLAKDFIFDSLQQFKKKASNYTLLAFKLLPLLFISSIILNIIASYISNADMAINQSMLNELFQSSPYYIAFAAIIYAPIMEEILFRGYFYGLLKNKSVILAIFVSGLLFGFAHMATGSFTLTDLAFLPSYTVLGMIIAYSYSKSETIFVPILLHFLNNFLGLLIMSLT